MIVKELIEKLSELDENMEVGMIGQGWGTDSGSWFPGEFEEIATVSVQKYCGKKYEELERVVLETY